MDLIDGCVKLGRFLGPGVLRQNGNSIRFEFGDYSSEECLNIDVKTGVMTLHTWKTSGHNGSSFDDQERVLEEPEGRKRLEAMRSRLESMALVKQEADTLREKAAREREAALARLRANIGDY